MTRELEKEAEEYWINQPPFTEIRDRVVQAYIDSAEPREKQIDELKAQIKVLEQNLEDTEICENGLKNRIAELEAKIEKMKCCYNCKHSRTEYEHCKTDKSEKWEIKEK